MTNATIDNKVGNEAVVLWQYDKAYSLIALIGKFGEDAGIWKKGDLGRFNYLAKVTTEDFWDFVRDYVMPLREHEDETLDKLILTVWGRILGLSWPTYKEGGETVEISHDFFRRIIRGRFFLLNMAAATANYNKYLDIVFPFEDRMAIRADKEHSTDYAKVGEFVEESGKTISWTIEEADDGFIATFSGYDESKWTMPPMTLMGETPPLEFLAEVKSAGEPSVSYGYVNCSKRIGTPCCAVDGGTSMWNGSEQGEIDDSKFMSMSFTVPANASDEELAIIRQSPGLIYVYPAGIRYEGGYADDSKVIGFNGQDLKNMANGFAWADENEKNGGILAGTDKAQFPQNERES